GTERHRSRTCLASGYDAALVLKTNWGTGPSRSGGELTDGSKARMRAHMRDLRGHRAAGTPKHEKLGSPGARDDSSQLHRNSPCAWISVTFPEASTVTVNSDPRRRSSAWPVS